MVCHRYQLIRVIPAETLAAALASQSLLHPLLLTRLQIKGMFLHFLNDVFRLNSTLEAAQGVFQGLSVLETNFCQSNYTPSLGWAGFAVTVSFSYQL